jgi:DNA-binding LacI/PurR family transcriptional regulator
VNAFAARGLLEGLEAASRPSALRPAIVGFDSELARRQELSLHLLTAMRLPWDEIGRQAANLLWERSRGTLTGLPQRRLARMSLIPRLSCRADWMRAPLAPVLGATTSLSPVSELALGIGI